MKRFLTLIILATLILALFGCNKGVLRAEDIKFIEIRERSFKSSYAVDEEINFDYVFIVITLKDNKGEIVERVEPNMIEGFDTSTTTFSTETRAMRIKYKGVYTSYWNYVVSGEYNINTKARLRLSQEKAEGNLIVNVAIELKDMIEVKGMIMEVVFDNTRLSHNSTIEIKNEDWTIEKKVKSTSGFSLLYSFRPGAKPITTSGEILTLVFNIEDSGNANVELKNIILSDGTKDFNLPNAKLQ